MALPYDLIRAALFRLDAERSHMLTMQALRAFGRMMPPPRPLRGRTRSVMGLEFRNPVGLAAGLDKSAVAVEGLARLGFGFIEVGTVTPRPQPGNPRPRLFRLIEAEALINRMGFNNDGLDDVCRRLRNLRARGRVTETRLGVNIGKNRDTPLAEAADDYAAGLRGVYPYADYVTINLSSPNTPGLRSLQVGDAFHGLLQILNRERAKLAADGRRVPLLVKIAPDLDDADLVAIADAVVKLSMDGVIATNTTISRDGVTGHPLAHHDGGLSGRPLYGKALAVVARLARELNGAIPIVAVGGISCTDDARRMLDCGASLFQIYTGFVYRGPALVRDLAVL